MENTVVVTNIQRFSLHDGPGIRTTVFLKGCNLRCPWCCNPENIQFEIQNYKFDKDNGIYGYNITLKDLEKEILKDKEFYCIHGGVTFSGGECLLQFDKLEPLLKKLKEQKINICIETALMVPENLVDIAIKYVDEFIIDIKILDENIIGKINGNTELYNKNIEKIFNNKCNVTFRIPLVPKYTLTESNLNKIIEFLKQYRPTLVEIFKIHRLGEKKYKTLNKEMPIFEEVENAKIKDIEEKIQKIGLDVKYCRI